MTLLLFLIRKVKEKLCLGCLEKLPSFGGGRDEKLAVALTSCCESEVTVCSFMAPTKAEGWALDPRSFPRQLTFRQACLSLCLSPPASKPRAIAFFKGGCDFYIADRKKERS